MFFYHIFIHTLEFIPLEAEIVTALQGKKLRGIIFKFFNRTMKS